ncbi:glycosyltransferase [Paracoccus jiaweipingae]|uniref:glycosyltransferase n=1 Tax=unclassified Paracoccus (in: a-proteobacteria) TaxID=2688777 RepID=UPI0037BDB32E
MTRIFGYLRFSYLGRSDVKLARSTDDLAYRASVLYTPERLEERFYFFEKICLPSLKWQTDQDFKFAIFTSPELPSAYQERLRKAIDGIPQAEIVYDTASHITHAIDPWMQRQDAVKRTRTVHFRLDDDDALSTDFVATLREHLDRVPDRAIITRPNGLFLINTPEGPELLAKFEPYIAIGFAIVNPPGLIHNPYALQHGGHFRTVPSLMLPGPFAYIHTAHAESDTREAQSRKLKHARNEHQRLFGRMPRRFRLGVRRQFNDFRPEYFHRIIQAAPSVIAGPEKDEAPATLPEPRPDSDI